MAPYSRSYGRAMIATVLESESGGVSLVGRTLRVGGWVKTGREAGAGAFAFLEVNDGSCFQNIQVGQEQQSPSRMHLGWGGRGAAAGGRLSDEAWWAWRVLARGWQRQQRSTSPRIHMHAHSGQSAWLALSQPPAASPACRAPHTAWHPHLPAVFPLCSAISGSHLSLPYPTPPTLPGHGDQGGCL